MAQQAKIDNLTARAAVFQNGRRQIIELPTETITGADTFNIVLPKRGIGLFCEARISGTITRACPATEDSPAPALSALGPYTIFKDVVYRDASGITRINAGGPLLHAREITQKQNYDNGDVSPLNTALADSFMKAFALPTYQASTNKTAAFACTLMIPFTPSPFTTLGTFPFNISNGDNVLSITVPNIVGTTEDYPIKVKSGTEGEWSFTGSLNVTYHCIDIPQGTPQPYEDFSAIFELMQKYSATNLTANAIHSEVLPTGRTYRGIYQCVYDTGVPTLANVDSMRFVVDGSTPHFDISLASHFKNVRRDYNRDMPAGILVFRFDEHAYTPDDYGELALQLRLGSGFTGGSGSKVNTMSEALYRAAA